MEFELRNLLAGALGLGLFSALLHAITLRSRLKESLQAHVRQSVANRGRQWHGVRGLRRA